MFIGHFGVGFGAKSIAPKASLGTLFLAAQLLDLLWPTLLLLGIERVQIVPGATAVTPLLFEHYPVSHSLLAVAGWAALAVQSSGYLAETFRAGIEGVAREHREAAYSLGMSPALTMRRIVLPQLRLGLAAAWIVVFVLSFGELGATVLIAPPGESTLPIRIYTIIANAPPAQVAALALIQTLVVFAPLAVLGTIGWLRPAEGRDGS